MQWGDVARSQAGVVCHAQLTAGGLSDSAVHRIVAAGALERQSRGVYLARGAPWTYRAQLWWAVLATGGMLGFGTAAHLWGMADQRPNRIEVVIDPARHITVPHGVRVHRVFTPASAVTRTADLPITCRSHSLLDHLGRLPPSRALRLADRGLQQGWITPRDLDARLSNHPGRQGNATLRRIAASCTDGAAAESERRLHRLLRRAGISDWLPNYRVWAHGDLIAVVDVALPEVRLAIEVDGWAYHSDVDRFQRDRSRQNDLVALGWTVLRFTWADITQRPESVLAAIRSIVAS